MALVYGLARKHRTLPWTRRADGSAEDAMHVAVGWLCPQQPKGEAVFTDAVRSSRASDQRVRQRSGRS